MASIPRLDNIKLDMSSLTDYEKSLRKTIDQLHERLARASDLIPVGLRTCSKCILNDSVKGCTRISNPPDLKYIQCLDNNYKYFRI